jgi:hypothetical protein
VPREKQRNISSRTISQNKQQIAQSVESDIVYHQVGKVTFAMP